MEQYELQHHGIKGMKWGIRRFQKLTGGLTAAGKKRYAKKAGDDDDTQDAGDDYKTARAKSVKQMSDAELRAALNRFQMEQQYSQFTAERKSAGRKWVEGVLSESGKEIAKGLITKYGKKGIEAAISYGASSAKTMVRRDHIAKIMAEKKK